MFGRCTAANTQKMCTKKNRRHVRTCPLTDKKYSAEGSCSFDSSLCVTSHTAFMLKHQAESTRLDCIFSLAAFFIPFTLLFITLSHYHSEKRNRPDYNSVIIPLPDKVETSPITEQ